MTAFLAQIARLNPELNAIVAKLDDEACLALADKADRALGNGGPIGPLHGLPTAFKDLEPAVGFPQSKGSPIFKDFMPDVGLGDRRAHPARRRDSDRQDQRARVRHGLADLQQGLRDDAQSVRSHEDRGRIERRRRGGAGVRHAADRRRRRSRRLASQSGQLQQHRRAAAQRRAGADGADADSVRRRVDERRDGAIGGGCRVRVERDGRRRRARSAIVASPIRSRSPARSIATGAALRVAWSLDLGGLPLDRARPNGSRGTAQDLRRSRLHCRRRVSRLRQRQRDLS